MLAWQGRDGIWSRAALLHAIFSRVVCLLFSLLFNVRTASQQLVAVAVAVALAIAVAFTAKILNKLLPHLQLRKRNISMYKKSMPRRPGITWRAKHSQLLCGPHKGRHCAAATPYSILRNQPSK